MNNHSMIRIPVTCPVCRKQSLMELTVSDLAIALLAEGCARLYAPCHDLSWNASSAESDQIRQHLRFKEIPSEASTWIKRGNIRAIPMSRAD
jgi:hypothetical protein